MATAYSDQFQSLIADVMSVTNRTKLSAETEYALRFAIQREHNADDYPSDLEPAIGLTPTVISDVYYRYAISIPANLVGFRKVATIAETVAGDTPAWFGSNAVAGSDYKLVTPSRTRDSYGVEISKYYLVAGQLINIKSNHAVGAFNVPYYKTPVLTNAGLASYADWLADRYSYLIVNAAASEVFKMIGKDDEAAKYRAMLPEIRLDVTKGEIGAI